jgi:Fe-S cluster biogenesis protein NfuA
MASGYVSWTTPDGNSPNPVYIDDTNKSVEFSAREDVAPYTITKPIGSVIYTLSNLGIINGFQCYRYAVYVTATTTTTTTTTEPPEITLSTTGTCIGGALEGSGRVVASGFSGGVGTYYSIRIGTSMEEAFDATPILLSGATSYTFNNLNSAVWYVLLTDVIGNQGYARQIINCTNTTTTVAPTSTTTQASTTTTTSTSTTSTSTTTTTGAPLQFNLSYDPSSGTTACSNYPDTNTAIRYAYYTATLGNGIQLFTSNALTTPVPNGYYSNGTNYWLASGGASILNSQRSCIDPCGFNGGTAVWLAPPTTSTTTAAPTTTTAAPTTTTAAPTTTTAAPTTTTAAPTTTTTAAPSYRYSAASANDACIGGLTMTNVLLIGGAFCSGTGIQCDEFQLEAAGINVWVTDGTNVRYVVIDDPNISGTATYVGACSACSAITTTTTAASTTTTTAAPPTCFYAVVTSTDPTYGASISATLCDGTYYNDNGMFGTQTICVQSISVSGGDFTNGGGCSVETTTTAAPTTTTAAPEITTTAPPLESVFCDCGEGCIEYFQPFCPPGCEACAAP